jgi:hypothetical protein
LRVESACVKWGDDEGLGPWAGEGVGAEGDDVVGSVAGFVAHEGEVAFVCLHDGGGFEVVFVEAVHDFVERSDVVVVGGEVYVAAFFAVSVRVQCV